MGTRNTKKEELDRLGCKTLDAQFKKIITDGLNCSMFEAEAVLEAVREVYFPFLDQAAPMAPPGKVTFIAVSADEPAGKPIAECTKLTVCLSVHRGEVDDRILKEQGPSGFRRARIPDLCQEALSQGALLTREDFAYHVFFVSTRTISRDFGALRSQDPSKPIPLRSTLQDIGPVLTHRVQIVSLALEGKTMTEICSIMKHSPQAVSNYLSTFSRCAYLAERDMQLGQIAFLLKRSKGLVQQYLDLLNESKNDKNMTHHAQQLRRLQGGGHEKKRPSKRSS